MGYNSRDNEIKLVEEKKEEDGKENHEELHRNIRDEDNKRLLSSAVASESSTNREPEVDSDEDGDEDDYDVVGANANGNANGNANEPSDMQLQDMEDQQPQQVLQQQLQPQQQQQHQQQQQQQPSVLNLNFASTNATVGMQAHLHQANLMAQQLLERTLVAQHQQQAQLMTSSLNSLQLGASAFAGQVAMNIVPTPAVPIGLQPTTSNDAAAAAVAQIQMQQRVLAQQQAAAQAAALSIGAVTSSQQQAAGRLGTTGAQQPTMMTAPLGGTTAMFAQGAPPVMMTTPSPPYAAAPLLGATGPLVGAIPGTAAALSPTGGESIASLVPVPIAAVQHHQHQHQHQHHHRLAPQLTIPHYVPPIPPTWGAQVPALSVQDRPLVPPIYNGINPNYPGAQLLHAHPPIFAVENFLTPAECDFLIENANDAFGPAPVVGKGSGEVSPSRTSSTCYLAREDLPEYLRKVGLLAGKPAEHCELPQVGRYMPSQQYLQHFDAFDLGDEDGRRFAANGGQRTVTVLVYLNDVARGGATSFPNLNIEVQPRRGMALVFFPATLDGLLDKMALHAALPAVDVKYVSQVWIRQSNYEGRPSKRLVAPMVAGLQERREETEKILMGQLHHQQQVQQQQQLVQAQHLQQQQLQQMQGYQQMNG